MDPHRTERLAEALREELSELIAYEMSDPRVSDVTVSDVVTSPDKRHAQVLIGLTTGGDPKEAVEALEHAKGFLRRQLAERLDTYRIPELHFEADVSVALGPRMEHVLKRVRKGRPRDQVPADGSLTDRNEHLETRHRPLQSRDEPLQSRGREGADASFPNHPHGADAPKK
jgi:ribosome-binding factor A